MNKMFKEISLYAIHSGLCCKEDYQYVMNQLALLFDVSELEDVPVDPVDITNQMKYITPLLNEAVNRGLITDDVSSRDAFEAKMMDIFIPMPSVIERTFWELYEAKKEYATEFLYNLSLKSNYIKTDRVSKNITWTSPSKYGDIDMTINVSKPEKTVEEIKRASKVVSKYPKCPLCLENVGFAGTDAKPARNNLRTVPVSINNEEFQLQYSPYVYYNEHSIVFKSSHDPMTITGETFKRLLDFVEQFPNYFLGSNADLPIVGGSILSHEHYQGGAYEFPIQRAKVTHEEVINNVTLRRLYWPLTVIQLEGKKDEVIKLATSILDVWKGYSDEDADILSKTDVQHNTITPIGRMKGDKYQLDLALRNNRTSADYPDGIFHSHPEHHHIKRENLGLIEVMGLSVLPARLVDELRNIEDNISDINQDFGIHSEWVQSLRELKGFDIKDAVSKKFVACLENAGVFKNTDEGDKHFAKFIEEVKNV